MTQDIKKLSQAIQAAKKAEAEIDALCAQADKAVKDAEEALAQAKEAKRALYESVGRSIHRGRPKGSKNKPKVETETVEKPAQPGQEGREEEGKEDAN